MNKVPFGLPQEYIDQCIDRLYSEIQNLQGKKLTILGGTGFFGSWISSILIKAIDMGLDLNLNICSRNKPLNVSNEETKSSKICLINLDIGNGIPRCLLDVSHVVFAATSSTPNHGNKDVVSINRTSKAFEAALKHISEAEIVESVLNLSSGAVYKSQSNENFPIGETNIFEESYFDSYKWAKIEIEKSLIQLKTNNPKFNYSSPRLFAFYGPGLPTDAHFAIGNFIRDACNLESIKVNGDKYTVRSYLHVADATVALFKLLLKPQNKPINLGSISEISMEKLALKISEIFSLPKPNFIEAESNYSYYVPSVNNLESWIGKFEFIEFEKGLRDWFEWLKIKN